MKASYYFVAVSSCLLLLGKLHSADTPPKTPAAQVSENPKWFIIRGTESPNGRYAIAWTLRNEPAVWDAVCASYRDKEQRDYEDDGTIEIPADHVENLLVDSTSGKILATLFSSKNDRSDPYWELPHLRPNRHFLEAAWSPDSKFVVVNHTFRWDCSALAAVHLSASAKPVLTEIRKPLVEAAQRFAKSSSGAGDYKAADLDVSFSELKHVKDATYHMLVDTVAEKVWAANPAQIDFTIVSGKGAPSVKVLKIKER